MSKGYKMMLMSALVALTLSVASVSVIGLPNYSAKAQPIKVAQPQTQAVTEHYAEVGTRVLTVEESGAQVTAQPKYDIAAVTELVSLNRVFGYSIYDDTALIDAAQIVLLDKATEIDGFLYIEKQVVNEFIYNMYGRAVDESAGEIYGLPAPDGCYAILPRSYDLMSQSVTDIAAKEDGTLTVTTEVTVAGLDFTETFSAVTVLSPAQTESGYIITSSERVQ